MPTQLFERSRGGEHALLVQPHAGGPPDEAELEEFAELARSAGATVAAQVTAVLAGAAPDGLADFVATVRADDFVVSGHDRAQDLVAVAVRP